MEAQQAPLVQQDLQSQGQRDLPALQDQQGLKALSDRQARAQVRPDLPAQQDRQVVPLAQPDLQAHKAIMVLQALLDLRELLVRQAQV